MRKRQEVLIPKEEIARQMELCRQVARRNRERSVQPLAPGGHLRLPAE